MSNYNQHLIFSLVYLLSDSLYVDIYVAFTVTYVAFSLKIVCVKHVFLLYVTL